LNDDILLFLPELVFLLELIDISLLSLSIGTESSIILNALKLLLVKRLEQSPPPFFHFNESAFQPLPEFIILCSSDIRTMPDLVLDKLFYLMDPLSLEHVFLDGLDSDH